MRSPLTAAGVSCCGARQLPCRRRGGVICRPLPQRLAKSRPSGGCSLAWRLRAHIAQVALSAAGSAPFAPPPGVPSLLVAGNEKWIVSSEELRCACGTSLTSRLCRHITLSLLLFTSYFKYGGCSSIGRAPDCGSGRCGFESHYPPHKNIPPLLRRDVFIWAFGVMGLEQFNATRMSVAAEGLTEANHNLRSRSKRVPLPTPCKKPLLSTRQKRFFTMISVPVGTGDIADAMISASQMIYASRM